MAAAEADTIFETFQATASQSIPHSCIPAAFLSAEPRHVTIGEWVDASTASAPRACREIPASFFTHEELFGERPNTLPPGFYLRRTPVCPSKSGTAARGGTAAAAVPTNAAHTWSPNLYCLVMGPGYRKLFVRPVRNMEPLPAHVSLPVDAAGNPQDVDSFVWAELLFGAYCIVFSKRKLSSPGVQCYPAFLPSPAADVNWWARKSNTLELLHALNTVPPVPPGICFPFDRLAGELAVDRKRGPDGTYALLSRAGYKDHPVIAGRVLFPAAGIVQDARKDGQDGSVGYLVYRANIVELGFQNELDQPGQCVVLYARVAFGRGALDSPAAQLARASAAMRFALSNLPPLEDGSPAAFFDVAVHGTANGDGRLFTLDAVHFGTDVATLNVVNADEQTLAQIARFLAGGKHASADAYAAALPQAAAYIAFADMSVPVERAETVTIVHADGMTCSTFEWSLHAEAYDTVAAARAISAKWASRAVASPVLHYLAPPDVSAFHAAQVPVTVIGFCIRVRLGTGFSEAFDASNTLEITKAYRALSDAGTRLMWDAMFFDPHLLITSSKSETLLNFMTDKAPGILNVRSAKFGMPPHTTDTSMLRRIKDPSPALQGFVVETTSESRGTEPTARAPPLTREAANAIPLLRLWIQGPPLPTAVPGAEVSIYRNDTKGTATKFSGTCHSWPVYGGYVYQQLHRPRSADFPYGIFTAAEANEAGVHLANGSVRCVFADGLLVCGAHAEREASVDLLFPPLYNTVKGQVWSASGYWRHPDFAPRAWQNAYGVCANILHRAMLFLIYPAYACEYRTPGAFRIWDIKQACEAVLHFMSRFGRLVRGVLVNRRRSVRSDFRMQPLNDVWRVRRAAMPDAPIADMFMSAFVAFQHNLIVGESPWRARQSFDASTIPGCFSAVGNTADDEAASGGGSNMPFFSCADGDDWVPAEVTTGMCHFEPPPDAFSPLAELDFSTSSEEDEDDEDVEEDESGTSTKQKRRRRAPPIAQSIIFGPSTMKLMQEIDSFF